MIVIRESCSITRQTRILRICRANEKSLNFSNASESTFVTSFRLMRSSIRSASRILSKNTSFRSTQSARLPEATIRTEKCHMQTAATCRIWKAMPMDALRWSRFRICLMTEKKSVRQESEKRSGKETSKWQQIFWAIRTKQAVR